MVRREGQQPKRQEVGAQLELAGGRASVGRGSPPGGLMGATAGLPNMRLKLAGLSLLRESECCALARTNYRSTARRPVGPSPAA